MNGRRRPNPIDRQRASADRRRVQRAEISGLAARLADAIRFDDQDALDQAQAALHQIRRVPLSPPEATR